MAKPSSVAADLAASPDFTTLFHRGAQASAAAPGRVNLLGDHTDYNAGYVLPMILPHETHVEIALRNDRVVHVWSANTDASDARREYRLGEERPTRGWLDYVQGVTSVLRRDGDALPGMDL